MNVGPIPLFASIVQVNKNIEVHINIERKTQKWKWKMFFIFEFIGYIFVRMHFTNYITFVLPYNYPPSYYTPMGYCSNPLPGSALSFSHVDIALSRHKF